MFPALTLRSGCLYDICYGGCNQRHLLVLDGLHESKRVLGFDGRPHTAGLDIAALDKAARHKAVHDGAVCDRPGKGRVGLGGAGLD